MFVRKFHITQPPWFWVMIGFTLLPYLAFVMILMDRYLPPLDRVVPALLPWKQLASIPVTMRQSEKILLMQNILEKTKFVSHAALSSMIASFTLFGAYVLRIYQQQKRRSQENQLLQLKNQEIARRNEFIRHISATIGHEFKNNVARVKRRVELLDNVPPEARERIQVNFDKLFSDIEIFKRIADEREAGLVNFQNLDLRELLGQLARQYDDFAETEFVGAGTTPRLYASVPLLWAVFENLFDNAVKYKKPEQARARITVTFSTTRDGERRYLSVSLRDHGLGMTEEQADLSFYKGSSHREGWGQGLYFSKYVVGLHAGRIRIGRDFTAPGKGTEVIVHLPYVEEEFHV